MMITSCIAAVANLIKSSEYTAYSSKVISYPDSRLSRKKIIYIYVINGSELKTFPDQPRSLNLRQKVYKFEKI